ncbi:MAG: nucleoside-triphosphatase [Lachnospiraceae bacterium]
MHTLIVGARGVGKSTLIRRVLEKIDRPVFGFETRKEEHLADEKQGSPIYIYEAGKPHILTDENLVGYSRNKQPETNKKSFDRFTQKLLAQKAKSGMIVMDELGFMESASEIFCAAVMSLLDGDVPVIAAVKDMDTPFLKAVRSHPNCQCFYINLGNREALCSELVDFLEGRAGE